MNITRRAIIASATASTLGLPPHLSFAQKSPSIEAGGGSQNAQYTYKFANNLPVTHPLNIRSREMANAVNKETKGRVEIKIYPASQLGTDTEMLKMLRAGEIDFFTLSGLILSSLVPLAAITGVGFAFPNYSAVWNAVDSDLGAMIRKEISKENLIAMDRIWDNGFRHITSSTRPITSVNDLKGMKIRVPTSPMWTSMFKVLGAAPRPISFSEVHAALGNKTVEGQENPLAVIDTAKLYEVQKFCSLTYHMWDGFWFLANRNSWENLPEDLRNIVSSRINAAALLQRVDVIIMNTILQKILASKGLAFNQPGSDSFREEMRKSGFYSDWKSKFGSDAWTMLERSTGKLV